MISFNVPQPTQFGNYMLKDFNEIIFPEAISFAPNTLGAWALICLVVVCLTALVVWLIYRWHKNAYRREALKVLSGGPIGDTVALVPSSLRKVASQAYPQLSVGILSGAEWFQFLNTSARTPLFPDSIQKHLQEVAFQPPLVWKYNTELNTLSVEAAIQWIAQHKPQKDINQ
ncbi:DUF4381 domain-containing protein [Vibrio harveyi]|uniref:DUF4381 domain-containing protein n=1 Tax=Vibrio harveyi TaxID=669 RepID=UPI003AABDF44